MKARADFASSELGWLLVTGLSARFASSAEETEMHVSESQQARRLRMAVQPPTSGRAVTIPSAARPRRQIEESHFAQSRRDSRTQPRVAAAHPGSPALRLPYPERVQSPEATPGSPTLSG